MRTGADGPGMIKALTFCKTMYAEGLISKNITAMKQNRHDHPRSDGRIAMTYFSVRAQMVIFESIPKSSKFPGAFKLALPVVSKDMLAKGQLISTAEFWATMIPRIPSQRNLAWSLIREISTRENTVKAAINGNGPVRASAYSDARLIEKVPYAALEAQALRAARVPMPAFNKSAEAKDIFVEEMQAAMLGLQPPEVSAKNMTEAHPAIAAARDVRRSMGPDRRYDPFACSYDCRHTPTPALPRKRDRAHIFRVA